MKITEDRRHDEKDGAIVKITVKKLIKGDKKGSTRVITHISKHGKCCSMGGKSQLIN